MSQAANVSLPTTRGSAGQDSPPEGARGATATHTMVVEEEDMIYSPPPLCFCVVETLLMAIKSEIFGSFSD